MIDHCISLTGMTVFSFQYCNSVFHCMRFFGLLYSFPDPLSTESDLSTKIVFYFQKLVCSLFWYLFYFSSSQLCTIHFINGHCSGNCLFLSKRCKYASNI
jgi:hypothetical protein